MSKNKGISGTPEYQVYQTAKDRCTNPNSQRWHSHGGRGIKFLFKHILELIAEIGPRPTPEHSLDRYPDNDGNYEPGNVRWATRSQQQKNKRAYGKGYGWHEASGKWYARIHRNDKETWLGTFDTKKEAKEARERALDEQRR
jgi:hypothetical protein